MAIRNILHDGDPSLLKKSRVVTDFDRRLHLLLDDMRETMIEANGVGLAAPQVGVLRRAILIIDLSKEDEQAGNHIIEMINPEILDSSCEEADQEGCLSIPGVFGIVSRPHQLRVRAQDRKGKAFEMTVYGRTARAVCHEVDHLDGILFTKLAQRILTEEELDRIAAEREGN